MPDPTAQLTFEPATPAPITDGVLFSVTGPVERGRIEVRDADGKLHQASPEFGQKNRVTFPDAQVVSLDMSGAPGGGTFKLSVYDRLSDTRYGETAAIAYNASAAAVATAINNLFPDDNPATVSGDDFPYAITFGSPLAAKFVSVTVTDNSLSGGTSPRPVVSESTSEAQGGTVVAGGPYTWGPVYLPDEASSVADLIVTADYDDGSYYEGDSLLDAPVTVYDFGDL